MERMVHRISLALLLVVLVAGVAHAAEETDAPELRVRFRRDFSPESPLDVRQQAVERLRRSGRPEAVPLLLEAVTVAEAHLGSLVLETEEAREALARFEEPIFRDLLRGERRARLGGAPAGLPESVQIEWDRLRGEVRAAATRETAERDLRERAGDALGALLDDLPDPGGAAALRGVLENLRARRDPETRALLAGSLGAVRRPLAEETLVYLLVSDADPRVQVAAATALGRRKALRALEVLVDRLSHPDWSVRAASAWALGRLGPAAASAIEPLVALLEREDGRLREDAVAALAGITGQDLGPYPERWRAWLAKSTEERARKPDAPAEPGTPTFYGIRTLSKRLLFILDRSGSMREPANPADPDPGRTKLALMERELWQAVSALPGDAMFNVIVYHHVVGRFDRRRALVPADDATRRALLRFLESLDAVGATNIHDALEAGFRMAGLGASDREYEVGIDTIFFLTDGNPTHGKITDPDRIAQEVRRWNALRRIRIHVVAVGQDVQETFLRRLAEDSGGQFVKR